VARGEVSHDLHGWRCTCTYTSLVGDMIAEKIEARVVARGEVSHDLHGRYVCVRVCDCVCVCVEVHACVHKLGWVTRLLRRSKPVEHL